MTDIKIYYDSFSFENELEKVENKSTTYLIISFGYVDDMDIIVNKLLKCNNVRLALFFSDCDIDNIESICKLKNIVALSFYDTNLKTLPKSICDLVNLKHLHLEYNRIEYFPENIYLLDNLKTLTLRTSLNPSDFLYLKI
jgi:Leucine-rich repeat (LRR) protein